MHDPIGGFERIRDLYLTYLETAFRIRDEGITRERRHLLETPGQLCTEPLVEPVPRYESSGVGLDDLVDGPKAERVLPGFSRDERLAFAEVALAGLFGSTPAAPGAPTTRTAAYPLYTHQEDMLTRGVQEGRPGVVTSGTGSGKTESFLLPVLASLVREARSWPAPAPDYLQRRWWHGADGRPIKEWTGLPDRPSKKHPEASPFRPHREGEASGRSAAVRALVLYPMNALVEDQLTRIRLALDSDEARAVMDEHLNRNRLFFGRYTGATPVTNHHRHPRFGGKEEADRRNRKLKQLHEAMVQAEEIQTAARDHDREHELDGDDRTRFLFPSTDGAELVSRWDMQETPPDLLVTNTSMLNAMLMREVEAPILDKTRAWIESDPDAYFYLVLDELHLQRGSSGTEVAYLLRVLLDRLGLTAPQHRHKLRILASSASLPVEGPQRDQSLKYLYDAFGMHGTWRRGTVPSVRGPEAWADAVVPGSPVKPAPRSEAAMPTAPFEALYEAYGGIERITPAPPAQHEAAWRAVADALAVDATAPLARVVAESVAEAGARIAAACADRPGGEARATTLSDLAASVFGSERDDALRAVRGLLVVRGTGDVLRHAWAHDPSLATLVDESPSFRLHTFFRAIEGLFAAPEEAVAVEGAFRSEGRSIGPLSIERGTRFSKRDGGSRGNRVLEVLYCECCGELFYGGRRSGTADEIELLPHEPKVAGLPDAAQTLLFEDLSYDDYAVFWPSTRTPAERRKGEPESGGWAKATLAPATGVVRRDLQQKAGAVPGYLYDRPKGYEDSQHHLKNDAAGTAVPFACPFCGTNYGRRRASMRLSPIRSFRAGFAKTTQLLATELFDALRLGRDDAKLISFSDSRQEAARAALDVEASHHADLRRDLLVTALRAAEAKRAGTDVAELQSRLDQAVADSEFLLADQLQKQIAAAGDGAKDPAVPVREVVESIDHVDFKTTGVGNRAPLRPFLAGFARLGLHPTDPAGTRLVKSGDKKRLHWADLFTLDGPDPDWREDSNRKEELDEARGRIVSEAYRIISDALFSRNYFSLEETGIGYPCVLNVDPAKRDETDAYLRVFTDAYRLRHSPWAKDDDELPKAWGAGADVPKQNRVYAFAAAVGTDDVEDRLGDVLKRFRGGGHADGLVSTAALGVRLVDADAPFWRCDACGRVHLHRGTGTCTRCFRPLRSAPTGTAAELQACHYLAKRLERDAPPFRLRCEELTGQTHNPADRQRRFRGVILDAVGSGAEVPEGVDRTLRRRASEIDLLTVTTTMEVGVDVGSLQATVQANMPPQRFNYQQRVGRAGRRRQAYSIVLTVCRNRSHDLYYFRHPEAITGDAPPPPFLSKDLEDPALRFVRKAWLRAAFAHVRDELHAKGQRYPGDDMRPPDIHGEFVRTEEYVGGAWRDRLRDALQRTQALKDHLVSVLVEDAPIENLDLTVEGLLTDVDRVLDPTSDAHLETTAPGLGQTLAEAGLLPMLGMPTRVRNLYYAGEITDDKSLRTEWKTVDRDLDVAIFEFAPGAVLINDKRQLECVGFTGPLPTWPSRKKGSKPTYWPESDALSAPFWLVECESCNGRHRYETRPDPANPPTCESCDEPLDVAALPELRVPNGFRTDLYPKPFDPEARSPRRSGFGLVAESKKPPFKASGPHNLAVAFKQRMRTYRVNKGPGDEGFTVATYKDWFHGPRGGGRKTEIMNQLIEGDPSDAPYGLQPLKDGLAVESLHLASPKTTDALFLAPRVTNAHLSLLPRNPVGERVTAVRAAALSAAFLLTYRAAQELDVDPDELEVVEPRIIRLAPNAPRVPLLQVTDKLLNGAGYCRQLSEPRDGGAPLAVELIESILHDRNASPLQELLEPDHVITCDPACYRCLQRYGTQAYHGLLDWRLGLAYLQALVDPAYACGLDGPTDDPALADWLPLADKYASSLVDFHGAGKVKELEGLIAFQLRDGGPWGLVVHPLWNLDDPAPRLDAAIASIEDEGGYPEPVDTFTLSRTALAVRERLR